MKAVLLEAQSVSLARGDIRCLTRVDLSLKRGELVGLIGPNGAGKSSLLKVMAGLQKTTQGTVLLQGKDISAWDDFERARTLGYLAQSSEIHWPLQVSRLVALGRVPHLPGWASLSADDERRVAAALRQTDTWHLKDRAATTLSGGEKCRVLLARVLAGEPGIVLADEPIAALDPAHQLKVMNSFRAFSDAGGGAVLALHDLSIAARYCDRLALLRGGELVAQGTPDEVITEARLASVYGIKAKLAHDENGCLTVTPYAIVDNAT